MPNKPTKSSKTSGKLKLNMQTIKDLNLRGDKAGKLKGGAYTLTCPTNDPTAVKLPEN